MVLDNQSARIQVGDQVAIPTQALTDTTSTNITNSIEYRDTGIVLSVTPRVNPGGLVLMEIEQEVSNVKDGSDPDKPTISTRNISSTIAVDSGKTVVLGGLIRDEKNQGKEGIPGLYKIPVLGWAFGTQNERTRRTELVIMLTPRVIASAADAQDVADDFRIRLKGLEGAF
jgi:general secretion pathway protein D